MENKKVVNAMNADTIDLIQLAEVMWKKIWILIACFVVGCTIAASVTEFLITPQYEATATIYIFNKTTSITSLADIQMGNQLTVDFQIIAKTRDVIERVIAEEKLDTTYEKLVETIVVENPKDSHMLKITVRNPDAALATSISNALADILREQVADVMNTDKPSMVERAVVPVKPVSPVLKKNALWGGLLAFVTAAGIITMFFILDDSVKDEEDVQKYLGLTTLASIPYDKSVDRKNQTIERKSVFPFRKKNMR